MHNKAVTKDAKNRPYRVFTVKKEFECSSLLHGHYLTCIKLNP